MNKRGSILIIRFMTATFVLFLVLGYLVPFRDTISDVRIDLDCTNTSITTGTQITCLGLDMTLWYFVFAILIAGFGILFETRRSS